MKIRLEGTLYDVMSGVEKIKNIYQIKRTTSPVKEPKDDEYVVYIDVE
ncbi:hypothetical protein NSQ96_13125 [Caldifermentibacillus hisashii]|uniref:Phage protein n=1 Tax=Caldifermentibacillus hisashii TaxID=996558 RepID=A0ABU9K2C7_9BACI